MSETPPATPKHSRQYDAFVAKFAQRESSDDCFTPPNIYEAVVKWCEKKYGVDRTKIVRPFCPGGDFENFDYPTDCVVLDNPPFSILRKIVRWYSARRIKFFLFCQSLTALCLLKGEDASLVTINRSILYDNGANVATAFVHNLGDRTILVETAPDLAAVIKALDAVNRHAKRVGRSGVKRNIVYPACVALASNFDSLTAAGIPFAIRRTDGVVVKSVGGVDVFGDILLLSDRAADDLARARAKLARLQEVRLTPAEQALQKSLGKQ